MILGDRLIVIPVFLSFPPNSTLLLFEHANDLSQVNIDPQFCITLHIPTTTSGIPDLLPGVTDIYLRQDLPQSIASPLTISTGCERRE